MAFERFSEGVTRRVIDDYAPCAVLFVVFAIMVVIPVVKLASVL